ncbi:DMT family transporter [Arthrospira platensis]|jgi:drug/metabolite transporter (DMT)-like permease|uniref:EamA domain-containing protein n=2 Tax=Oscillatoriales TaxID=1150 RepID=A0A5M3T6J7_LIMPL|nr:DMT family transporter [Arthrospira platensis]AMW31253.1 hypothetical protein AP285_28375 [Arthrospira platensis YZ]KDR58936.1 membrane protein [Arthrospira platensis str. Paraca]MBD2667956.1 DMT family transporter [Arthrospira platensis FACHB-439]MBD2708906.1 DMT family transporter [Arthrospira platensis FACHB-835]MDF2208694.1 DMT family transporter [Arthrospira platensis NCB002]MDT9309042.1 DMT family transporter [Limnospira sp. Paracas R14]BAI94206.1 hypothetical protein NIES39_Q01980 
MIFTQFPGEISALVAALFWAIASVIYANVGTQIPPLGLNLIKGGIAIGLLLLTITLQSGGELPEFSPWVFGLLPLSGIIGIGIGDTAFFTTLNCLGPRRALLLETLAPPLTALIAFIFLGERLSPTAWGGIFLTVLGIAWVITERAAETVGMPLRLTRGLVFGSIAALSQSTGAILSHLALTQSGISPLWSTLLRIVGGVGVLVLALPIQRLSPAALLKPLQSRRVLGIIMVATFFGTYLGIWLQQTALKFTAAGIAQTLTSTSPLFVLPIAIAMGDRVSWRAILGALVAIFGVAMLFLA